MQTRARRYFYYYLSAVVLLMAIPLFAFGKVHYQNTKKQIDINNWNIAVAQKEALPADIKAQVLEQIEIIKKSEQDLVLVHQAKQKAELKPVYVIVQGVTLGEEIWWGPFGKLLEADQTFYFYKYSKRSFLNTNIQKLKSNVVEVLRQHPGQEVRVIGYSGGGALALLSLDQMEQEQLSELNRLKVYSLSAPINGYAIPQEFMSRIVGGIISGYTAVEFGLGVRKRFKQNQMHHCEQFITTNPELDYHARVRRKGVYPLMAPLCGESNVHLVQDQTHYSIAQSVVEQLILRLPESSTVLY